MLPDTLSVVRALLLQLSVFSAVQLLMLRVLSALLLATSAVVNNEFGAEMTRRHNHANILCMGGRVTTPENAIKYTKLFLSTPEEGGRHDKRVAMLTEIENGTFSF